MAYFVFIKLNLTEEIKRMRNDMIQKNYMVYVVERDGSNKFINKFYLKARRHSHFWLGLRQKLKDLFERRGYKMLYLTYGDKIFLEPLSIKQCRHDKILKDANTEIERRETCFGTKDGYGLSCDCNLRESCYANFLELKRRSY